MEQDLERGAREVVSILQAAGHKALYAGGCVRDRLRGVPPADYDIATSARPELLQKLFPKTVAVGVQFGVVCVLHRGSQYQVATFRSDGAYLDGRHPQEVSYGGPEEDAMRRDFTVNGMFFDPVAGEVIDWVGGREDLERGIIRAIGDPSVRFAEDRLRLLRAIRFAAVLGFEIDPSTWDALAASHREIRDVSAERIREELVKIFLSPARVKGFDLLDASGLLEVILPEVAVLKGCDQPPQFHPEGDVFVHTRLMLGLLTGPVSIPLVFSVLFHDIGKPPTRTFDEAEGRIRFSGHDRVGAEMTERVMVRLRFSRAEIDATVAMVANHMVFKDVTRMRVAKLRRFLARPTIEDEMILHKVDCESSHGSVENYDFLLAKRAEFASEPLIPKPLINGREMIGLGWKPGPGIGAILESVQNLQLEGALATKEEALAWVKENHVPGGPDR
jgi:poly(A) polymerase